MNQNTATGFKEKLTGALAGRKSLLIVLAAGLIVILAGVFILDIVRENRLKQSSMLSEDILEAYNIWKTDSNPPENRSMEELDRLTQQALDKHNRLFAAQRALFTLGLVAYEKQEWESSWTYFEELSQKWKKSYLAPVSLFNAASAREQQGDLSGAELNWQRIVDSYNEYNVDIPEALFNIARINETGNVSRSLELYRKISSDYPENRWANISRTRVLQLELSR